MKVNNLLIAFFAEDPPCSAQTCPEMRASEWQYLCAVHEPPKSCCAIDYCCHTLDWATNTLTSPKYFPSRLTLGSETAGGPQASMRHLTNIFRRLYRIFAHAWFQHRSVFWEVEGNDGLYVFFKTVCDMFSLIPEDNYTIPAEAEGLDASEPQATEPVESKRLTILRKDDDHPFGSLEGMTPPIDTGATTRRHKHSPSTGSHVGTITEAAEDSEDSINASVILQATLEEAPGPRPQSPVKAGITAEEAAETTEAPNATETAETAEAPEAPALSPQPAETVPEEVQQTEESPVKPEETTEQQSEETPEKDEEQLEPQAQESEEPANPEAAEKFPEADDATTPSTDQASQEVPEPEAEPKTES